MTDALPGWTAPTWTARSRSAWRAKLARLLHVPARDLDAWEVEHFMREMIAARERVAGTPQPAPKEPPHD